MNYKKIADTTTLIPGNNNPFITLSPPTYNGIDVVFYGNNNTIEGIYFAAAGDAAINLVKISDSQTSIPVLSGPPLTNQNPNDYKDAYIAYPGGLVSTPSTGLSVPCPMIMLDGVTFFAANQVSGKAGIFFYKKADGTISSVVNNVDTPLFLPASVSQPSVAGNKIYFSAMGSVLEPIGKITPPPGVYVSGKNGADAPLGLFDLTVTKTSSGKLLDDIGNSKVMELPGKDTVLYFYGSTAGTNGLLEDGIYSFAQGVFNRTLTIGQVFGNYTVPQSGAYAQISLSGSLLAFQTCLNDSDQNPWDAVMAIVNGTPVLIQVLFGNIPGNSGTYTGNAVQLATDGVRVAFVSTYEPATGFGERAGLFVWNSSTQKLSAALLDKDMLDGKEFFGMTISTSSFSGGKLAAQVTFYDQSSGIYILDLSDF